MDPLQKQPALVEKSRPKALPYLQEFREVLDRELESVRIARQVRGSELKEEDPQSSLIGMSLSGGGIRSATLNLGILQAFARTGVLKSVDYLSTVSGGGYIGSWLQALIFRRHDFAQAIGELPSKPYEIDKPTESPAIRYVRNYSNYLTPQVGFLSADTWSMIATYLRNVLLNQSILAAFLAFVILIPYALMPAYRFLTDKAGVSFQAGLAVLLCCVALMAWDMIVRATPEEEGKWSKVRKSILPFMVVLVFASAFLINCAMAGSMYSQEVKFAWWQWMVLGAILYGFAWLVIGLAFGVGGKLWTSNLGMQQTADSIRYVPMFLGAIPSGAVAGLFMFFYARVLTRLMPADPNEWAILILGTTVVIAGILIAGVVHIGMSGSGLSDLMREWYSRFSGLLMIGSIAWSAAFGIAIYGPLLVRLSLESSMKYKAALPISASWVLSTIAGALAGQSSQSGGKPDGKPSGWTDSVKGLLKSPKVVNIIAKVAPYIFVIGFLILISTAVSIGIGRALAGPEDIARVWSSSSAREMITGSYWDLTRHIGDAGWKLAAAIVGLFLLALGISCRVDVNEFSLHHFYRNRLIRAYLGASRKRRPQPFTKFDEEDDLPLADLGILKDDPPRPNHGPYPILNTALNVNRGLPLGFADRKAKSFTFTPDYCGYDGSYAPTGQGREEHGGVSLGTAMAISGAAVSPNWGYHTSPATAFFMTLFGVRLGWWMGNPRYPEKWRRRGPRIGLFYLLSELLANTSEYSDYLYLSDGGHFENLGVYELVRRRCSLIIACDGSCDESYGFEDLMNAIEKCRTDFGVNIEIDVHNMRPLAARREVGVNFQVGSIWYDRNDKNAKGALIYIKSSLPKTGMVDHFGPDPNATSALDAGGKKPDTLPSFIASAPAVKRGDLPADVYSYARIHGSFPHDTTADQWFSELQFESYRALGEYIGSHACDQVLEFLESPAAKAAGSMQ